MDLFAKGLLLRNCGRFLHVASDFGSNYKTLPFLSSEMLYAGLSREQTRTPRQAQDLMGEYDFFKDFRIKEWPVWFTPAMLVDQGSGQIIPKSRRDTDTHLFNSLKEGTPGIQEDGRYPKFGSMETILPDRHFWTLAISPEPSFVNRFEPEQVFWMGKKRTMFQIAIITETSTGKPAEGECTTPFLQVISANVMHFKTMEILAGTQRYLVIRGDIGDVRHWTFTFKTLPLFERVSIPAFSIDGFLRAYKV